MAASVLARRSNLSSWSFARHLRQLGTPLLAVPISDEGKGDAIFLRKETAVGVRSLLGLRQTSAKWGNSPRASETML